MRPVETATTPASDGVRDTALCCPECRGPLRAEGGPDAPREVLSCGSCERRLRTSPTDFFYDFRAPRAGPVQQRSLLVHERAGFYANEYFMRHALAAYTCTLLNACESAGVRRGVILDVGCGGGRYAAVLEGLYATYIGLEPSDIPPSRRLAGPPPAGALLVHNDPTRDLPVQDESVNLVLFNASYDHLPHREAVLRDAVGKLQPGGYLFIGMTNYDFWLKRIVNRISGRQLFQHRDEHYCVHTPRTLVEEVRAHAPELVPAAVHADFLFLPNLPRGLSWLYGHPGLVSLLERCARILAKRALRWSQAGSAMLLVFQKPGSGGPPAVGSGRC